MEEKYKEALLKIERLAVQARIVATDIERKDELATINLNLLHEIHWIAISAIKKSL